MPDHQERQDAQDHRENAVIPVNKGPQVRLVSQVRVAAPDQQDDKVTEELPVLLVKREKLGLLA